ncbi:MAG: hypothetical protein R3E96_12555, partial [Planctomycetota bacterium]
MAGVSTISASSAYRPTTSTLVSGFVLAEWADGKILAAVDTSRRRVDLGLYPPSGNCISGYYNPVTTDAVRLMANALEYAADRNSVGAVFCEPAATNSTGQAARLRGNSTTAPGSGVHLEVDQGPPTSFGYFLVGTGAAATGIPVSQGLLCLAATGTNQIGRYNVVGGALNSVGQFNAAGELVNLVGTSTVGTGFDVPSEIPSIGGSIAAGQTWHFQAWFREAAGASNFTNGLSVTF